MGDGPAPELDLYRLECDYCGQPVGETPDPEKMGLILCIRCSNASLASKLSVRSFKEAFELEHEARMEAERQLAESVPDSIQPKRCPTCGSDEPSLCGLQDAEWDDDESNCPDPFHSQSLQPDE